VLTQLGIHLTAIEDQLYWSGGDRSGILTAQNVYAEISNTRWHTNHDGWKNCYWSWYLPPKIKFFTWMLIEHKINTWDILLRKGWTGPSYCHLCQRDSESINHLFINCQFFKQVWTITTSALKSHSSWDSSKIADCFEAWTNIKHHHTNLPPFICWTVWLERNSTIFNNTIPSTRATAHKTLGLYHSWMNTHAKKSRIHCNK